MNTYLLFIAVSALYIASPGPGVILTVSNSLRYGFVAALPGIFGIALGMFCVGLLAATGVSMILQASAAAFTGLKYLGATYLIFVGIRQWRSAAPALDGSWGVAGMGRQRFCEGLGITLLNPKATVFYIALYPQFVDPSNAYAIEFIELATSFSALLIVIHCIYSALASAASTRVAAFARSRALGRTTGAALIGLGIALATTDRTR